MNKKIITLLTVLLIVLGISGIAYVRSKKITKMKKKQEIGEIQGQSLYHPISNTLYPIYENKKFVVIIPSYNNEKWCERNLRSVYEQEYNEYRVIYIDDNSKDATYEKVKKYVKDHNQEHRTNLIRNEKNKGALLNLYNAIHSCKNNEIIVTLDGDDWFPHEFVLFKLNECYANPKVWLTFGQYLDYPTYTKGMGGPIFKRRLNDTKGFRLHEWVSTHLRTFYAGLFKKIKLKDFFYQGIFFKMGWDYTFMLPMLEMCHDCFMYIPEVMYIYNRCNPISDDRLNLHLQRQSAIYVRFKEPYLPINTAPYLNFKDKKYSADIYCFSKNPENLKKSLNSIVENIKNYHSINVFFSSNDDNEYAFKEIQESFPKISFSLINENNYKNTVCQKILYNDCPLRCNYILFINDENILDKSIDLNECISMLEKTNSDAFYLKLNKENFKNNSNICMNLWNGVSSWQYNDKLNLGANEMLFNMVLVKKQNLKKVAKNEKYNSLSELSNLWKKNRNPEEVGLFFDKETN